MITCINYKNLHEFGAEFYSSFKLRHESFIARQSYDVSVYNQMEFDQYDTPAATYLVYHDDKGTALGVSRITPTVLSSMLEDLFPQFVDDHSVFKNPKIWEGTRYCINKDLPIELRKTIVNEMALAYLEFGMDQGLSHIVGMMPTYIYRSVFERPGIKMEYLGDIQKIDGHKVRAVSIPINQKQLDSVREKANIHDKVLRYTLVEKKEEPHARKAAA